MPNVDLFVSHRETVAATRAAMLQVATAWSGTPYLLGGDSRNGIDCSHLVYQALNEARQQVALPGTAPQVVDYRSTDTIVASKLFFGVDTPEPGDLVLWDGHVGIVMDPNLGTFIGAQTSTGVAVASYTSGYWAKRSGLRFVRFVHFF
jgi:cell wall-associated NlpC family hydrolase